MNKTVCVKSKKAHKNQFCELSSVLVCQPVIPLELEVSSLYFPIFPQSGEEIRKSLPLFPGFSHDFCHQIATIYAGLG